MRVLALLIFVATATFGSFPASAQDVSVGSLVIRDAWARATPRGAPVAGGFMLIENRGDAPERLVGGSVPVADHIEVHEMSMINDVMRMRPVTGGLVIPPGGSVQLKPGSYHLMFMGLKEPLVEGATVAGTLQFERAGAVDVTYSVRSLRR